LKARRERISSGRIKILAKRGCGRRDMLWVVRTRGCRRCGGDLSLECDIYGDYIQCLQCGASYNREDLLTPEILRRALKAVKAAPAAATSLRPSKPEGTRR
jgi:hypothetical protein